jgi:hypothetical protein
LTTSTRFQTKTGRLQLFPAVLDYYHLPKPPLLLFSQQTARFQSQAPALTTDTHFRQTTHIFGHFWLPGLVINIVARFLSTEPPLIVPEQFSTVISHF